MSRDTKNEDQKLNIAIDEHTADGIYSNLAVINHSATEFIVDFIAVMPGSPKAKVRSRIILTPEHAKRLNKALKDNIERFENVNGEISVEQKEESLSIPLNFGPTGEA